MGNSALRSLADIQDVELSDYQRTTVAVDAHHWLYRYMTSLVRYTDESVYTTDDGNEVANLVALLRGLPTLLREDITPVFVFDGAPHELKAEEIATRREAKANAAERMKQAADAGDVAEKRRNKAQTQSLTPTVHETSRVMLSKLGIPFVEADGAGEAFASKLVAEGHATAVLTDDYDALLFGSPETVRRYSGDGPAERMRLKPTLDRHGITHEQLVDIALLAGTDYNSGVHGIGAKRGLNAIKELGSADAVLAHREEEVEDLDVLRDLFLHPSTGPLPTSPLQRGVVDFSEAVSFARDWELPGEFIRHNIERFPEY